MKACSLDETQYRYNLVSTMKHLNSGFQVSI